MTKRNAPAFAPRCSTQALRASANKRTASQAHGGFSELGMMSSEVACQVRACSSGPSTSHNLPAACSFHDDSQTANDPLPTTQGPPPTTRYSLRTTHPHSLPAPRRTAQLGLVPHTSCVRLGWNARGRRRARSGSRRLHDCAGHRPGGEDGGLHEPSAAAGSRRSAGADRRAQ